MNKILRLITLMWQSWIYRFRWESLKRRKSKHLPLQFGPFSHFLETILFIGSRMAGESYVLYCPTCSDFFLCSCTNQTMQTRIPCLVSNSLKFQKLLKTLINESALWTIGPLDFCGFPTYYANGRHRSFSHLSRFRILA